ncbi:unnamed protein product [Darwinula stevensoni]|uniref:Uncharacterized protein n=1 Tax=Darwinula stevensoni TaxID=69355 RepID=A0A7R8X4W7_9CRUS|nr:unnamed protein product [Darwinula stevensoni]CAG0879489.1 unnamed protein product [Darwinula stevensoni]
MKSGFPITTWLLFLFAVGSRGLNLCPPYDETFPCSCIPHEIAVVNFFCFDVTVPEILYIFNNVTWHVKELHFLTMNALDIAELPEGVFGDVSFQEMWLQDNRLLTSVHATALLPSKNRLVKIVLERGYVNSFPFDILPEMTALKELKMASNSLTEVPVLRSNSLEILDLAYNRIRSLKEGAWSLPNLATFLLHGNELMTLPAGMVSNMERLVFFECSMNHLGPTLPKDSLNFASPALQSVRLHGNRISSLEPGAITGLHVNTSLLFHANFIEVLDEASFRPIVESILSGSGYLELNGNPLACDCDLAWLVINGGLRFEVTGFCRNDETPVAELDPEEYIQFCT